MHSIIASNSGNTTFVIPKLYASINLSGLSERISFSNSAQILSALIFSRVGASFFIAFSVFSSISNPSCAENLTALSILKASSVNLSSGSFTHLITFRCKSPIPSNASTTPYFELYAMAFIVKSLRFKSSIRFVVNSTDSGCLLSLYSPSILYVVTS